MTLVILKGFLVLMFAVAFAQTIAELILRREAHGGDVYDL